ncbi:MAG: lamin tail domain-containing protein [Candidatus Uhrbacteria bacterium]
MSTTMRRAVRIGIFAFFVLFSSAIARNVGATTADHIVIAEVQVGGVAARDEFVELYNPTAAAISIEGWQLSKWTGTGARKENLVLEFRAMFTNRYPPPSEGVPAIIPAHGSVLVAPTDSTFGSTADVVYTTQYSLGVDNTVVLYGSEGADGKRVIVDLVGMGTATLREGVTAPNPPASQSIERKPGGTAGNSQDTDDNKEDFLDPATPSPQNSAVPARPPFDGDDTDDGSSDDSSDDSGDDDSSGDGTDDGATPPADTDDGAADDSGSTDDGTGNDSDSSSEDDQADQQQNTSGGASSPLPISYPSYVRINEFVSDPDDGDEWIELINIGDAPVNLASWIIEDGTETRTILNAAIGTGEQRFYVIYKPKGRLNNSGDRIVLRDPNGRAVDAVSYGDWNDGRLDDNAPTASDPASVARVSDGVDTDNDRSDFVRTETPTPGEPNVVASVPQDEAAIPTGSSGTRHGVIVVLNELLPNPVGDDLDGEYIELINLGDTAADLGGWRIADELGTEFMIPTQSLASGATAVFLRRATGIALNNTGGETVRLYKPPAERATSTASYKGEAPEGWSWARRDDGRWTWSIEPTPNAVNLIKTPNHPPDVVVTFPRSASIGEAIVFDGSDSADADSDALTYFWDFGDSQTEADVATTAVGRYVYAASGSYTATFTVTDARGAAVSETARVEVRAAEVPLSNSITTASVGSVGLVDDVPGTLQIVSLLPNPIGSDEAETLVIGNAGSADVSLEGWQLVINGSSERKFELSGLVPARGELTLERRTIGFVLRNAGGMVSLVSPGGAMVDETTYDTARDGERYVQQADGGWVWMKDGAKIVASATTASSSSGTSLQRRVAGAKVTAPTTIALHNLRSVDFGEDISVTGSVTAVPGSVGKQIFYIGEDGAGVQVFFGARAIQALALGDRVRITGEYREANGESRIGIKEASDVELVGGQLMVEPSSVRISDLTADDVGTLVAIEGEAMETRGNIAYVDDSSDEIRVAFSGTDTANALREGDTARIVGIVSATRSGLRLRPRGVSDISAIRRAAESAVVTPSATVPIRRMTEFGILLAAVALVAWPLIRRRFRPVGAAAAAS